MDRGCGSSGIEHAGTGKGRRAGPRPIDQTAGRLDYLLRSTHESGGVEYVKVSA